MGSGWRVDTKLHADEDRAWTIEVSHTDDAAKPGTLCLMAMRDRQLLIGILSSLGFGTLEGLCDFTKCYDFVDYGVLFE